MSLKALAGRTYDNMKLFAKANKYDEAASGEILSEDNPAVKLKATSEWGFMCHDSFRGLYNRHVVIAVITNNKDKNTI